MGCGSCCKCLALLAAKASFAKSQVVSFPGFTPKIITDQIMLTKIILNKYKSKKIPFHKQSGEYTRSTEDEITVSGSPLTDEPAPSRCACTHSRGGTCTARSRLTCRGTALSSLTVQNRMTHSPPEAVYQSADAGACVGWGSDC